MTLAHLLLVASAIFAVGLYGVLARRHAIGVLLSIELMFNAVNLAVVSIAWSRGLLAGVVLVLFGIAITVAEIAVGLALVLLASRVRKTVILDDLSELRGRCGGPGSQPRRWHFSGSACPCWRRWRCPSGSSPRALLRSSSSSGRR
jgi:NADH-quinone oxidoreductase subunit K